MSLEMDGALDFDSHKLMGQNFYIWNALGQNLDNSEPCLCLRLLKKSNVRGT